MITKFNDANDMNSVASDAIYSYIKDGYRIDAKESTITSDDRNCTFKAVLTKDVDGIECKTIIKLIDNGDENTKSYTYHKVETVGDTKWSEETRTFSTSTNAANGVLNKVWSTKSNTDDHVKAGKTNTEDKESKYDLTQLWDGYDNLLQYYLDSVNKITGNYNIGWSWLNDDLASCAIKRLADVIKTLDDNCNKENTKWECECPSMYKQSKEDNKRKDKVKQESKILKNTTNKEKKPETCKKSVNSDSEDSIIELIRKAITDYYNY